MNIILCGACGRMGKNVTEAAAERGVAIVAGVDIVDASLPYPLYHSLAEVKEQADVVVDFSSAAGLGEHLGDCLAYNLPIVLAATGFTQDDLTKIDEAAKIIPVFKTGNFSLGINLLQMLAKKAAQILGDDFDVEIVERHHHNKKDAPSGTALMLAESANEAFEGGKNFIYGREDMVGARDKKEIGIHAVRGGTIVGEHEVMFAGEDEIITLSHSARSKKVFAAGAVKAAKFVAGKPAGRYDMHDVIG